MLFQKRKARPEEQGGLPRHIGIIMDGNGRWAKKRGLPRMAGHRAGAQVFRKIARYCNQIGIQCLTVYAFSTENWKRPKEEVDSIMELFRQYLREALEDFKDENIVTRFIGDRSVLAPDLIQLMAEAEEASANKTGMILNIAINYGGRQEIVYAARRLAQQCLEGKCSPDDITEQAIDEQMDTAGQPDPDLIIRPSGEMRTSNFLLWQSAYSEYLFDHILWPDFKTSHIDQAIEEYRRRNRRFGGV
ncbi:isoprenyl transferase [[Clostridium] leptum]|uniref:Isoprenyl transferase n=1 Tax=Solibaculum mannosilyticum TaxID=2780922 RepID=A0A7I8D480_9FIRM|nr:isoprenyl transferase [Solibaculum mannosilyticum]MCO7136595.1 isoprenyl transferase [[Clostridium] leptum]BCI60033.1 isoprenyl transferase [Solibaculum mannosilyticum]